MKDDRHGSCWFLEDGKYRIYDQRSSVCRIYPHMLRRSAGSPGHVTWRQFAHPNEHGRYDPTLPFEECLAIAREVKEYENAYLTQQISFLETMHEYFTLENLRHDPEKYQQSAHRYLRGRPVDISVYHAGELEEWQIDRSKVK